MNTTPPADAFIVNGIAHARKAALARDLGVNRATITRAAQAGRLVPAAEADLAAAGWYQRDASLARYRATRGGRIDLVERHAATRPPAATPSPGGPDPITAPQDRATPAAAAPGQAIPPPRPAAATGLPRPHPDSAPGQPDPISGQDRAQVKGQILATENAITKLEIALTRGHRLPLADVGRESHAWGQRLADHLLRVIDQVAARLAAVPDPAERQRLLRPELRRVRRAFDQAGIASLRALKSAGRRRPDRD